MIEKQQGNRLLARQHRLKLLSPGNAWKPPFPGLWHRACNIPFRQDSPLPSVTFEIRDGNNNIALSPPCPEPLHETRLPLPPGPRQVPARRLRPGA
ncbi:hypothetical protein EMIT048CA2_10331 [Pseudomonas chlororaphis]